MENIIRTASDFVRKIRDSEEVKIKFVKKNGETRIMRCTLDFNLIPKMKQPKSVNLPKILNLIDMSRIVHVYDLDKKDWRSVPFDRSEWIESNNVTYRISH